MIPSLGLDSVLDTRPHLLNLIPIPEVGDPFSSQKEVQIPLGGAGVALAPLLALHRLRE